jgi:hypothetical protein
MSMNIRTIDPDEEAALLDGIDRWVEREVKPVVMKHDHGDIWPARNGRADERDGAFRRDHLAGVWRAGPAGDDLREDRDDRIASVWMSITGIFNSHLIMALAVETLRHRGRSR